MCRPTITKRKFVSTKRRIIHFLHSQHFFIDFCPDHPEFTRAGSTKGYLFNDTFANKAEAKSWCNFVHPESDFPIIKTLDDKDNTLSALEKLGPGAGAVHC